MRRILICAALTILTLAVVHAAPQRVLSTPGLRANAQLLLSDTDRLSEFNRLLVSRNVPASQQAINTERFKVLPADLQHQVLVAGGSQAVGGNPGLQIRKDLVIDRSRVVVDVLKPRITSIWPSQGGSRDTYSFAQGFMVKSGTEITFNGVVAPSYFVDIPPFFPASVAFKVPASAALTSTYPVVARNGGITSDAFNYKVVAPRGYRGYYGWPFANFGDATIPWAMYKDFFGAAAVEYANGTHRLAAQQWYDSAYKGVGNGGNCYGMSVSSLRHRVTGGISTYWNTWFANPASHKPYVWQYPWNTQTKQAVQEDQGGQLSAEMASWINNYSNNQNHQAMFNRVNSNLGTKLTVLGMWGSGGHAIVPYGTKVVGNDRQLLCYDNNGPYSENETGAVDPSVAHVYWSGNTFAYGGYSKAIAMSYDECVYPPHLPASATGSAMGSVVDDTVVAVLSPGARVGQITDENGRRFFNADGSENQDVNTRIPNSSRFIPLTGSAPTANDPLIFVFGGAQRKSLSFNLVGQGARTLSFFQRGTSMQADSTGEGVLQFSDILTPTRGLQIPSPTALRPTRLQTIQVLPAGERSFELRNLSNLGAQSLRLLPIADGSRLEVQSASPLQFDLQVTGAIGQGLQASLFPAVAVQAATRALLQPQNWQDLRGGALNFELRGLQGNQLQNQLQIRPR